MWDPIRSNVTSEVTEGHKRSLFELLTEKAEIWHGGLLPYWEKQKLCHFDLCDLQGHIKVTSILEVTMSI